MEKKKNKTSQSHTGCGGRIVCAGVQRDDRVCFPFNHVYGDKQTRRNRNLPDHECAVETHFRTFYVFLRG